jgi:predicted glycosyltransferase
MRFELLPLLAAARAGTPRPLTICSVRDIVQAKRDPARIAETAELIETSFDHVLVHGDPAFVRFEETFPEARRFAAKLHYTGIIAGAGAPRGGRGRAGRGDIVVSAGGGAVGEKLLATAMDARPLTSFRDARWRLLAGPNLGPRALAGLAARAPAGVVVERHRRDFAALLAACAVSVSQAGYNTVADILRAGTRAVIVPYAAHGETEQSLRAGRLAERGLARVVTEDRLSPETLAAAIDAAFQASPADAARPDLNGAKTSARLVCDWLKDRGADGRSDSEKNVTGGR